MFSFYFVKMLETECFEELNLFGVDGGPTPDLIEDQPPPPPRRNWFSRLFRRGRVGINICENYEK